MQTPVALIIFNRPETTERVFAEIANARPEKLLVIADGPRPDKPGEAERCAAARSVVDRIDWPCEVLKNYSDVNLGCGRRPATGITWVFEQVEEAIILEDDCVPHPSFFRFCEELLARYRHDERVAQINANNFQFGRNQIDFSYYFSYYNTCWGWASWRRAWQHFDMGIRLWPTLRDTPWLLNITGDPRVARYFANLFDQTYAAGGNVEHWDYQWAFACWAQNRLAISPGVTLVSNVGFGKDATHTRSAGDRRAKLETSEITFPLQHPPSVVRDRKAERIFNEELILPLVREPSLAQRLQEGIRSAIPAPLRRTLSQLRASLS
jgi:hypothetical protein